MTDRNGCAYIFSSLVDLSGVGVRVGEGGLAVGADALGEAVLRVEVEHLQAREMKTF